jgi:hypothetical protein
VKQNRVDFKLLKHKSFTISPYDKLERVTSASGICPVMLLKPRSKYLQGTKHQSGSHAHASPHYMYTLETNGNTE